MKIEKNNLKNINDSLQDSWQKLKNRWNKTREDLKLSRDSLNQGLKEIKILKEEFLLLKENSDLKIQQSISKNNRLLKEIAVKESELASRSRTVNQLEEMLEKEKQALNDLKESLSDALLNFEGKGLTVEIRNGKVYISMENKLLFKSGQWDVEAQGKKAIKELAKVLEKNSDISILIEGHTDNIPYTNNGNVESNWDLSTKRATAVVEILLENSLILPQNLTAAGRSEFVPIASNNSAEGRASNRRIDVVLSLSLDKISALLELND